MKKYKLHTPYIGLAAEKHGHLFLENGDCAVVLQIKNPVLEYSADESAYYHFHNLYKNMVGILGAGYTLQKLDVFCAEAVELPKGGEFLHQQYSEHFNGRNCYVLTTYLVLTRNAPRRNLFQGDAHSHEAFVRTLNKIIDVLHAEKLLIRTLGEAEIKDFIRKVLTFCFGRTPQAYHNIRCAPGYLELGDKNIRSITLIDAERVNLPGSVSPHTNTHEPGFALPVDLMKFLFALKG